MFHLGQEVICVKLTHHNLYWGCLLPTIGTKYVIRWIGSDDVTLVEIVNPKMLCYVTYPPSEIEVAEPTFLAEWFAPIRKTDISTLTALLNPTPIKEDA